MLAIRERLPMELAAWQILVTLFFHEACMMKGQQTL